MYHVIIVEDDPMVASINRQYLTSVPQFQLDGLFGNGDEALAWLLQHHADLAIVDYYMPVMNGIEFIRACHTNHIDTPVIMITAANSFAEVTEVLANGVLDYIVKPFTYDRFKEALQKFLMIRSMQDQGQSKLSQEEIDQMLLHQVTSPDTVLPPVKGIQPQTLELLKSYMEEHAGTYFTSDEISRAVCLSRITIRRYLNYLLENHEIVSQMDYSTGGRPSLRYCISKRNEGSL